VELLAEDFAAAEQPVFALPPVTTEMPAPLILAPSELEEMDAFIPPLFAMMEVPALMISAILPLDVELQMLLAPHQTCAPPLPATLLLDAKTDQSPAMIMMSALKMDAILALAAPKPPFLVTDAPILYLLSAHPFPAQSTDAM
jgi:hypothetical protein